MKIYTFCDEKSALLIDGENIGVTDCNLGVFEHSGKKISLQYIPQNYERKTVSRYFETLCAYNARDLKVLPFYDSFLIVPAFRCEMSEKSAVLFYEKFEEAPLSVTVFEDAVTKLIIDYQNEVFFFDADGFFSKSKITVNLCGNILLCVAENGKNKLLYAFSLDKNRGTVKMKYKGKIHELIIEDDITIIKNPATIAGLSIYEKYDLNDFTLKERTTQTKSGLYEINKNLLCFSFLEEILYKGDYTRYLSRALKSNYACIPEFFDNFLFYLPFAYKNACHAVLVYESAAKCVVFQTDNGLISDFAFL